MNQGINIRRDYTGDKATWADTIAGFLKYIADDSRLNGRFDYMVTPVKEGPGRVHVGRWDELKTVQYLQPTDFFKEFAATVQGFADGSLSTTPLSIYQSNC